MRRRADGDGVESGRGQQRDHRALRAWENERERAGPELRGELVRGLAPPHEALRPACVEYVADQRIELRPALGFEYPGDRALAGGVGAEAVDRLGREGDELAGPDQACRFLDSRAVFLCGHRASLVRAMKCGLEKRGLP